MKKYLLTISFFLLSGLLAIGQTTATDFTASDCSSAGHTLFSVLDSGKIVVLVWVMPCATCISDSKAAFDAAQSFATSNPGKVLYWLSDDAGNTSCSSISSWAGTNAIGPVSSTIAFLSNAGNTIDQANYGGIGMPHVVVIGPNHHIYLNIKNGSNDLVAITDSIAAALATLGVANVTNTENGLNLFPNPAKDKVTLSYSLYEQSQVSIEVINVIGQKVKTITPVMQNSGEHSIDVNFDSKLANGIYFLRFIAGNSSQTIKFNIAD